MANFRRLEEGVGRRHLCSLSKCLCDRGSKITWECQSRRVANETIAEDLVEPHKCCGLSL